MTSYLGCMLWFGQVRTIIQLALLQALSKSANLDTDDCHCLTRRKKLPMESQDKLWLKSKIEGAPGAKLDPEHIMVEKYGVARATMREVCGTWKCRCIAHQSRTGRRTCGQRS